VSERGVVSVHGEVCVWEREFAFKGAREGAGSRVGREWEGDTGLKLISYKVVHSRDFTSRL